VDNEHVQMMQIPCGKTFSAFPCLLPAFINERKSDRIEKEILPSSSHTTSERHAKNTPVSVKGDEISIASANLASNKWASKFQGHFTAGRCRRENTVTGR